MRPRQRPSSGCSRQPTVRQRDADWLPQRAPAGGTTGMPPWLAKCRLASHEALRRVHSGIPCAPCAPCPPCRCKESLRGLTPVATSQRPAAPPGRPWAGLSGAEARFRVLPGVGWTPFERYDEGWSCQKVGDDGVERGIEPIYFLLHGLFCGFLPSQMGISTSDW